MQTLGSRLASYGDRGPGFDFLRIALAMGVLLTHCVQLFFGDKTTIWESPLWIADYAILPMFFALSGFLVAGSALRNSTSEFVVNRFLRIVPALAIEICLSALILGPIVTQYSLADYFAGPEFRRYFLNILGWIHFELPGVFLQNPLPRTVNASLWTIPHEILCYIVMIGMMTFGLLRRPSLLIASVVGLFLLAAAVQLLLGKAGLMSYVGAGASDMSKQIVRLLPFFMLGCAAYLFRNFIPADGRLFALAILLFALAGFLVQWQTGQSALFRMLISPVLIYMTVYVGLYDIPRLPFYSRGDYSYGVYLYGFPIQQTILFYLKPFITFPIFIILSIAAASVFAAFSWHVIEKPTLRLRKRLTLSHPVRAAA